MARAAESRYLSNQSKKGFSVSSPQVPPLLPYDLIVATRGMRLSTSLALLSLTAQASDVTIEFGNGKVRVQSLSRTAVRVEPQGPRGFEDRTTFAISSRPSGLSGDGLKVLNQTSTEAYVGNEFYTVFVNYTGSSNSTPAPGTCSTYEDKDVQSPVRTAKYPDGVKAKDAGECCSICNADKECTSYVFATGGLLEGTCWPLVSFNGFQSGSAKDRVAGCTSSGCAPASRVFSEVRVTLPDGRVAWSLSGQPDGTVLNNLNWPAPGTAVGYAFEDRPRFFAPEWGPTPIPDGTKVDPDLVATNGYDFRNDISGDFYIFLFPETESAGGEPNAAWNAARQECLGMIGSAPLLPDYAYGTWFTWWHPYTEDEAKGEIERWDSDDLPLDIWALDMNWRNSPRRHTKEGYSKDDNHYYNKPNTDLFPDFGNNGTGWFDYLKEKGLRTYFNDHPFPADLGKAYQTTKDEVSFRWDGLTHWLSKGLTFWWFDANWAFSIPPPQVPYGGSGDGPSWQGMTNRVWGSHVYYTTIEMFNKNNPDRQHTAPAQRPMSLTKYADANMHPGLVQHQHMAQHRYPVWWTGDGVSLQASVQSMVDSGLYDMKPFVHSDCGGDYRGLVGGDLVRWASHCALGTILRFHGSQHQPWSYDNATEDSIRDYIKMRYKVMPSLIAAGQQATATGWPIVVRGDMFWPGMPGADSNEQYLFLNDTLVAPIWDSIKNVTSRDVWIPPGQWQDAWDGSTVTGPKNMTVSQPYERIPMWHRVGGLVVTTESTARRVDSQDWSSLTLEAFVPGASAAVAAERAVYPRNATEPSHRVLMARAEGEAAISFKIVQEAASADAQAWLVRLHLRPGQRVTSATLDGKPVALTHLPPRGHADGPHFPFLGEGSRPAQNAGTVTEIRLAAASNGSRSLEVQLAE